MRKTKHVTKRARTQLVGEGAEGVRWGVKGAQERRDAGRTTGVLRRAVQNRRDGPPAHPRSPLMLGLHRRGGLREGGAGAAWLICGGGA